MSRAALLKAGAFVLMMVTALTLALTLGTPGHRWDAVPRRAGRVVGTGVVLRVLPRAVRHPLPQGPAHRRRRCPVRVVGRSRTGPERRRGGCRGVLRGRAAARSGGGRPADRRPARARRCAAEQPRPVGRARGPSGPAGPLHREVNYASGLLNVRLRHFVLGSAIGMVPGSLAYAALGAYGTNPWGLAAAGSALVVLIVGGGWWARRLDPHRAASFRRGARSMLDAPVRRALERPLGDLARFDRPPRREPQPAHPARAGDRARQRCRRRGAAVVVGAGTVVVLARAGRVGRIAGSSASGPATTPVGERAASWTSRPTSRSTARPWSASRSAPPASTTPAGCPSCWCCWPTTSTARRSWPSRRSPNGPDDAARTVARSASSAGSPRGPRPSRCTRCGSMIPAHAGVDRHRVGRGRRAQRGPAHRRRLPRPVMSSRCG